jgi:hypothetical protein
MRKKDHDSSYSSGKKKRAQQAPSILPDYLLKQVGELHKKEGASSEILKQDMHNRKKSNQLRKQREDKYKK